MDSNFVLYSYSCRETFLSITKKLISNLYRCLLIIPPARNQTARNITIGNKTKSFDGSGNISFSLDEIGAGGGNVLSMRELRLGVSISNNTTLFKSVSLVQLISKSIKVTPGVGLEEIKASSPAIPIG